MKLKSIIKYIVPYGLFVFWHHSVFAVFLRSAGVFNKFYKSQSSTPNKIVSKNTLSKKIIYMADGRFKVGGLSDRFRGMIFLYKLSKELNVEFKIYMPSPVDITHYLLPNQYDWVIDKNDVIYNTRHALVYDIWAEDRDVLHTENVKKVYSITPKLLNKCNQIHFSTNLDADDNEFGDLFKQLFKPAKELQALIDYHLSQIGGDFNSATFRFQQLLGDFSEGSFSVLPNIERALLINRCIEHLKEIHDENGSRRILVTSDSITFLNAVKAFDFIYVIPEKITHIDYGQASLVGEGADKNVYMKSFLDFYLLTYSKQIYLVRDGQMMDLGFAYRASLYNKTPYTVKKYL
jgi:hypothetical protein